MTGPDQPLPSNPIEQQRHQTTQNLQEIDRRHFQDWVTDPIHQRRLDLPQSALRYILIAPRALELADDPLQVGLVVTDQGHDRVEAYVVEHKAQPITDAESIRAYLVAREAWATAIATQQKSRGARIVVYDGPRNLYSDLRLN